MHFHRFNKSFSLRSVYMTWVNGGVKSNYALIEEMHLSFARHKFYFLAQEGCFFQSCYPAPRSGRRGRGGIISCESKRGLGNWRAICAYVCVPVWKHVCACVRGVGAGVGCGCRAPDARIKERLVEIKALPWSLPARLQATRVTNPSLLTPQ